MEYFAQDIRRLNIWIYSKLCAAHITSSFYCCSTVHAERGQLSCDKNEIKDFRIIIDGNKFMSKLRLICPCGGIQTLHIRIERQYDPRLIFRFECNSEFSCVGHTILRLHHVFMNTFNSYVYPNRTEMGNDSGNVIWVRAVTSKRLLKIPLFKKIIRCAALMIRDIEIFRSKFYRETVETGTALTPKINWFNLTWFITVDIYRSDPQNFTSHKLPTKLTIISIYAIEKTFSQINNSGSESICELEMLNQNVKNAYTFAPKMRAILICKWSCRGRGPPVICHFIEFWLVPTF